MFAGHKNGQSRIQPLKEHLENTAELAKGFAQDFGAGDYAYMLGLAHDIGKYADEVQKRILYHGPKADHSTAGAKELFIRRMLPASLCAAGHHCGLPDLGAPGDMPDAGSLCGRLKKQICDYQSFQEEITLTPVASFHNERDFDTAFYTRMVYSALVDADFLDTERFMTSGEVKRGGYDQIETLFNLLQKHIQPWENPSNELNVKRTQILNRCLDMGKEEKGLYSLTVPTGGGKTVSSLAFALRHADVHGMKRVIYVIPYTSIIEQTADIFRGILGEKNVLEHHANVGFDQEDDDDTLSAIHRLSAENWDAPIIVTTNVQFFESLYANKSSRCRKLHNIANSVVIFDEAQMLPLPHLKPCLRAIQNLVREYGVTAVLCTATQPSLGKFFPEKMKIREICEDTAGLYTFFKRTRLQHAGKLSTAGVAERMLEGKQALAIVRTRRQAAELYDNLPEEGRYHLSTLMYPVHRERQLKEIKQRLREGLICRVSATSLVEAGVDVDFPMVLRAESGLDSIIQAAGRCNREGRRPLAESIVTVYQPEGKVPDMLSQNIAILHEVMERFSDLSSPEAIAAYFDALHKLKDEQLDEYGVIHAFEQGIKGCSLPFAQVAAGFHLIGTQTKPVFIPIEDEAKVLEQKLRGGFAGKDTLRKAGRYMVNIYPDHFGELFRAGDIEPLCGELVVLTNLSRYDGRKGLSLTSESGRGIFFEA